MAVTILFLGADPTNEARLRLSEEAREIREKIQLARERDNLSLQERWAVRPPDLAQAMLDTNPQVVHFSGHGVGQGGLCFEDTTGKMKLVSGKALSALFAQFKDEVKCVVLNACYSEEQAKAIVEHIDYVVGMNDTVADRAAIAFAVGFYQALGAGRSVEQAFELGKVQILLQGVPDEDVPVLHKRQMADVSSGTPKQAATSSTSSSNSNDTTSARVFISHSSRDKDFVRRLADDLEKNHTSVWLDEREIHVGDSIPEGVTQGLQDSNFLIAVLSQNSAQSGWMRRELDVALMGQLGGKPVKVLPVRLDDAPVPSLLNPILYADFRTDYGSGLSKLLQAIQGGAPVTPPPPAARQVDRNKLIDLLMGLTDPLLDNVLVYIPGIANYIPQGVALPQRVSSLITYSESVVGPGLSGVADAVTKAFPNLEPEKLPFR